jgi:Predicted P-loop ATPase fused to an acetyltransferase
MRIEKIQADKKHYLALLLLGDEQESMIDRYLERGDMYALFDDDPKSICVVTRESEDIYEIKNIATWPPYQGKGYGKALIRHILEKYSPYASAMLVGTGNVPGILAFYKSCGFIYSHTIPRFFTGHYPNPVYEDGIRLVDMVYLKKSFPQIKTRDIDMTRVLICP